MSSRVLELAVRVVPKAWRERYEPEWRADFHHASRLGMRPSQVAQGALSLALRLRMRQYGQVLAGNRGSTRCVASWTLLAASLLTVTSLMGDLVVLLLPLALSATAVLGILLAKPSTAPNRAVVAVLPLIALGAAAAFFWAFGVGVDAADPLQPTPFWVKWVIIGSIPIGFGAVMGTYVYAVHPGSRRRPV